MGTWKKLAYFDDIAATKLDDFAAPDNNTDLNASVTAHGLCPLLSNVVTQFLDGQGGWTVPAGAGAPSASGTYTGDNTKNRAIAHGLGVTPKIVFIIRAAVAGEWFIHDGDAYLRHLTVSSFVIKAVTAMDSTNFYVGDSPASADGANYLSSNYIWEAIG